MRSLLLGCLLLAAQAQAQPPSFAASGGLPRCRLELDESPMTSPSPSSTRRSESSLVAELADAIEAFTLPRPRTRDDVI